MSVTFGLPSVIVPVLSKTTVLTVLTSPRTSPFLIKIHLCMRPVPTINAVGVAIPSAQGQAIIITETVNSIVLTALAPTIEYQTTKVRMAIIRTTGTNISATLSTTFELVRG